jgi:hypothetical protein
VRVGALDRVAEESDQANVRERGGDALRHERMKEVVGRRLARDEVSPAHPSDPPFDFERKERAVPVEATVVALIEEMQLFRPIDRSISTRGPTDVRVPAQVVEEARRAGALGADDDEAGQDPRPAGRGPDSPRDGSKAGLASLGDRRHAAMIVRLGRVAHTSSSVTSLSPTWRYSL